MKKLSKIWVIRANIDGATQYLLSATGGGDSTWTKNINFAFAFASESAASFTQCDIDIESQIIEAVRYTEVVDDTEESESELYELMRLPAYWRDGDPEITKKIQNGFKRLYGGSDA